MVTAFSTYYFQGEFLENYLVSPDLTFGSVWINEGLIGYPRTQVQRKYWSPDMFKNGSTSAYAFKRLSSSNVYLMQKITDDVFGLHC